MTFEWDDNKAALNEAKHDLSFMDAVQVFHDLCYVVIDTTRAEDNEVRAKAVGLVGDELVTVVYTHRDSNVRIISARRSNKIEERTYGDR